MSSSRIGGQFVSSAWKDMMSRLGVALNSTTAYHPQSNGLVERFHRQLKGSLKARLDGPDWMEELPLVLLGIRSAWKEGPGNTPAEMIFGTSLRLLGQYVPGVEMAQDSQVEFVRELFHRMQHLRPTPSRHHSSPASYVPRNLRTARSVYVWHDAVRWLLQRPYDGPFTVLEAGDKTFLVEKNGQPYRVSVDQTKAANTVGDLESVAGTAAATAAATSLLPLLILSSLPERVECHDLQID